jgi:hypothetical protein
MFFETSLASLAAGQKKDVNFEFPLFVFICLSVYLFVSFSLENRKCFTKLKILHVFWFNDNDNKVV